MSASQNAFPPSMNFSAADVELQLDPHDDVFVQNPYGIYAYLHATAPRFFWQDYRMWCFAGYHDVNRLLRDRRLGRKVPASVKPESGREHLQCFDAVERHSLLDMEPPDHTRLRGLVNRAFVSRNIEGMRADIETLANDLVSGFENATIADLIPAFATPIPVRIIARMLGVPEDEAPQLLDWSHAMVAMYMHGRDHETELKADRAAAQFADFVARAIRNIRTGTAAVSATTGLLGHLVNAQDRKANLSDEELTSSIILLLNAGHEATVHQIGNAIRVLLHQKGDPRRFFKSAEMVNATVEELLRIDPPLHMFTRFAYEEIDLGGGIVIRKNDEIGLLLGAANHDPSVFDHPGRFDPGRPKRQNVSFGAGIHFCIGAPLAKLELQCALKILFERLPGLALEGEPRFRDSYHFHGLETLRCKWQ